MECIICLETDLKKISVASPTLDSFLKLLERSRQQAQYMDNSVMDFVEHTRDLNPNDLLAKNASYHKSCYADIGNTTKIEHAKKWYCDSIESSQPSVVKRKAGRPSSSTIQVEKDEPLTTRSKVEVFDRKLCIICQTAGARSLTHVEFKGTGIHMLKVSEKLVDKSFFHRMNSITNAEDAVANEVIYHDVC